MTMAKNISKFFSSKIKKQEEEKKAKKSGIPMWISKMPDGSDKQRALRVHRANMKRKKNGSKKISAGTRG